MPVSYRWRNDRPFTTVVASLLDREVAMVRVALAAAVVVCVTSMMAACSPDRITMPSPTTAPAPSATVQSAACTGAKGEIVLRALFDDLSAGRATPVSEFFVEPSSFVRWWDPTLPSGDVITYQFGDGIDTVNLKSLQAHLDSLVRGGVQISVTSFTPDGYEDSIHGGGFTFTARGRPDPQTKPLDGGGKGGVDCATGTLTSVVIDAW